MGKLKSIGIVLLGAFLLLIPGLYNGYPLVSSDTGTYIFSGFDTIIPTDRPIVYGWVIRHISMGFSLWLVVLFQALITSYVLFELVDFFVAKDKRGSRFLLLATFLTFFTGAGWYVCQIMPDMFTPILFIALFLLLVKKLGKWNFPAIMAILFLSILVHYSHMILGIVLVGTIVLGSYIWKSRFAWLNRERAYVVLFAVALCWVIMPTINYSVDDNFTMSKGSHVFLVAHLADNGILEEFLQDNCSKPKYKNCKLCNYKDSLPTSLSGFLWSDKVFYQTGGWDHSKEEYSKIVNGTLTQPKFLMMNIYKSVWSGFQELMRNEIGKGLTAHGEDSPPYVKIEEHFKHELNFYKNGKQNQWNGLALKFDNLNTFYRLILIVSVALVFWMVFTPLYSSLKTEYKVLLSLILFSIILNAMVTGGLNALDERFQARVSWLLPMVLLLIWRPIVSSLKTAIKKA